MPVGYDLSFSTLIPVSQLLTSTALEFTGG